MPWNRLVHVQTHLLAGIGSWMMFGYWMPCGGNGYAAQVAFGMVLRRAGYGPYKNIDIVAGLFCLYFDLQMILITLLCRIDLFIKFRFDHPELAVCTPVYCILPG